MLEHDDFISEIYIFVAEILASKRLLSGAVEVEFVVDLTGQYSSDIEWDFGVSGLNVSMCELDHPLNFEGSGPTGILRDPTHPKYEMTRHFFAPCIKGSVAAIEVT